MIKFFVESVLELYYEDDILSLDDLQFYIKEQYNTTIDKKELAKYFNENIKRNEEDIKLQFKHIGIC